jgi:hypothetical protein
MGGAKVHLHEALTTSNYCIGDFDTSVLFEGSCISCRATSKDIAPSLHITCLEEALV